MPIIVDARGPGVRLLSGRSFAARAARTAFLPAACAYAIATRLRRAAYRAGLLRSRELPVPVFSVGNITTGGTGKTTMVEWLAGWLRAAGRRPAILSRGYGARPAAAGVGPSNDEGRLLRANLPDVPHFADPDRVAAGRRAVAEGADCLILDDGFQHLRLRRDLDMVLVDAADPFGGGRVLPAGLLREPLTALREADVIVMTRADAVPEASRLRLREALRRSARGVPIVEGVHRAVAIETIDGERADPESLAGKRVLLFCAVGNPTGVLRDARRLGAAVTEAHFFPDHYRYRRRDCAALAEARRRLGADLALTTQKDAVKLGPVWPQTEPLRVLRIRFAVTSGMEILERSLRGALER